MDVNGPGHEALLEALPHGQRAAAGGDADAAAAAGAERIRALEAYVAELEKRPAFSSGEFRSVVASYQEAISDLEAGPAGDVRPVLEEVRGHLAENLETPHEMESEASAYERGLVARIDAVLVGPKPAVLQPLRVTYRNWRGETAERVITPLRLWHGATEWHPEPQHLVHAWDHDKQAFRDFALADFLGAA